MTIRGTQKVITKLIMEMLTREYCIFDVNEENGGRIAFRFKTQSGATLHGEFQRTQNDIAISTYTNDSKGLDSLMIREESRQYEFEMNEKINFILEGNFP